MKALIARLSEPSSYASLTGILAMVGVSVPSGLMQNIVMALAGVFGIVGFFLKEKSN